MYNDINIISTVLHTIYIDNKNVIYTINNKDLGKNPRKRLRAF